MGLENWTEAQLRAFIQKVIDSNKATPELPLAPDVRVDDLLKHSGVKWQPYTMPFARVWRSTSQSIGAGAGSAINFDTEVSDTERTPPGLWDPNGDTSRLTCTQPGVYLIVGRIQWDSSSAGTYRLLRLTVNGVNVDEDGILPTTTTQAAFCRCATLYYLNKGDYVQMFAQQGDIGAHSVTSTSGITPILAMVRIP